MKGCVNLLVGWTDGYEGGKEGEREGGREYGRRTDGWSLGWMKLKLSICQIIPNGIVTLTNFITFLQSKLLHIYEEADILLVTALTCWDTTLISCVLPPAVIIKNPLLSIRNQPYKAWDVHHEISQRSTHLALQAIFIFLFKYFTSHIGRRGVSRKPWSVNDRSRTGSSSYFLPGEEIERYLFGDWDQICRWNTVSTWNTFHGGLHWR